MSTPTRQQTRSPVHRVLPLQRVPRNGRYGFRQSFLISYAIPPFTSRTARAISTNAHPNCGRTAKSAAGRTRVYRARNISLTAGKPSAIRANPKRRTARVARGPRRIVSRTERRRTYDVGSLPSVTYYCRRSIEPKSPFLFVDRLKAVYRDRGLRRFQHRIPSGRAIPSIHERNVLSSAE